MARRLRIVSVLLVLVVETWTGAPPAHAAPGDITTVAGGPGYGPAVNVGQDPAGLAVAGNRLWVADARDVHFLIRAIDLTTGYELPPLLERSTFEWGAAALAADGAGDLFIAYKAPNGDGLVEQLSPSGTTRVIAGGGTEEYTDGGQATAQRLHTLSGIAVDPRGNVYVSEKSVRPVPTPYPYGTSYVDSRVRKIRPDGTITTFAGVGPSSPSAQVSQEGVPARSAFLGEAAGLATDAAGNLYIAETGARRVRRVDSYGLISTFAGGGSSRADGVQATQAELSYPDQLATDAAGVLIVDRGQNKIRRVANGTITTAAGNGAWADTGDGGPATSAAVIPISMAAGGGRIYFGQDSPDRFLPDVVRMIDSNGTVNRLAGVGRGDGGPALQAQFRGEDMAVDAAGNTYIAEVAVVRRIDPSGNISTFAGTGIETECCNNPPVGDGGPATQAEFRYITDVAVGPDGSVYIVDNFGNAIRRVDPSGIITTVVGTGRSGRAPDGSVATASDIYDPEGIAFNTAGELLFGDRCTIRRINDDGTLTTIAGRAPDAYFGSCGANAGDGGPATSATFSHVGDLAADPVGNVYAAMSYGSVRRIDPAGIVTTVAGDGTGGDGGPATAARIEAYGIGLDAQNNLLIASFFNEPRVRQVGPDGIIRTIAGGGTGGDGVPATSSRLKAATAVATDNAGNLLILSHDIRFETTFGVIRKVSAA